MMKSPAQGCGVVHNELRNTTQILEARIADLTEQVQRLFAQQRRYDEAEQQRQRAHNHLVDSVEALEQRCITLGQINRSLSNQVDMLEQQLRRAHDAIRALQIELNSIDERLQECEEGGRG